MFPELPLNPLGAQWSHEVQMAHQILSDTYGQAVRILRQEDADPVQLDVMSKRLEERMVPILEALSDDVSNLDWARDCARRLGITIAQLNAAATAIRDSAQQKIITINPITTERTGRPGRPRKIIDPEWLKQATGTYRKISMQKISRALHIHRSTTYRSLRQYGIQPQFSQLSDQDLDAIIRQFKTEKPNSGLRFVQAHLRTLDYRVQKTRVRESLQRVDGLGQLLRRNLTVQRRQYSVPRPNHLWHCDGHHKLILWGIVIHGFIDGYCRTVTGLRASNNNRPSTVLEVFQNAVTEYGLPSRLRGDRGGENVDVSVYMIMNRGPNRASFMWGSSTRNSRIERLWVDVGVQFARRWRAFFLRLERLHGLDRKNPHHLWLIHGLFLRLVDADCKTFQVQWNHHSVRGRNTHDQTPADMRFLAMVEQGIHDSEDHDEYHDVHPELLERYYGVEGDPIVRRPGQTGAGHPPDEPADLRGNIQAQIIADQEPNIRHDPIPVARHSNPFATLARIEPLFWAALSEVERAGSVPTDMNLRDDEWPEEGYPVQEDISLGTRSVKTLTVALPAALWYPRALQWGQALHVLIGFMTVFNIESRSL